MIKKLAHSVFVNLSILLVLAIIIYGFSRVYAYFNTGADKKEILLLDSEQLTTYYMPKTTWIDNKNAEGRAIEAATRSKLEGDYLSGYYYQYQASAVGLTQGLKDYYTEDSREGLIKLAGYYQGNEQKLQGTTIAHTITPKFYSADGTLIVIADEVISYNEVQKGDQIISYYDTASYDVMLLLEDNYWRIRHKQRKMNAKLKAKPVDTPSKYQISAGKFYESGEAFQLKCINYYPGKRPWTAMWENFDLHTVEKDFKKLKGIGFNAVRIFVPFETFGKSAVDSQKINELNQLLEAADRLKLKVVVTLFDFFLGYEVTEWTISDRHAEQIVQAVAHHPSLFAWDVKNEPDLDFESFGKHRVTSWLHFIISRIKTYDPNHFVTIGWSQPEISNELSSLQDFISFHFYRSPSELSDFLEGSESAGKPIFLGETGMHSYSRWWFPFSKDEDDQAAYVEQILSIVDDYQLHYGIWTLYDFKKVPSNVAGRVPWKRNPQKYYGLIDHKGRKKKIYDIILKFNCDEK
ncbi:MAG: glycosyl hydrolase family 5 [Bacteroidota bacterium]